MIKAILMDFNGVVINDEPIQHTAYQEIFKAEGIELTEEMYYARLGMDDRTFVASVFDEAGETYDDGRITQFTSDKNAKWREIVSSDLPLFDGIEDFVEKMSHEFALGIVSMSARPEIDFVLERSGLAGHFSTIVSAEMVSNCKPDPECYRMGFHDIDLFRISQGHLPMTHGECLVIEDSPPGIASARSADLQALGVANTVSSDELRAAGAGAIASDLRDWMPESIRRVF